MFTVQIDELARLNDVIHIRLYIFESIEYQIDRSIVARIFAFFISLPISFTLSQFTIRCRLSGIEFRWMAIESNRVSTNSVSGVRKTRHDDVFYLFINNNNGSMCIAHTNTKTRTLHWQHSFRRWNNNKMNIYIPPVIHRPVNSKPMHVTLYFLFFNLLLGVYVRFST